MDVKNKEIILIGDFNCDWDPKDNTASSETDLFKDIASIFQLKQELIKGPTRITESSSNPN